MKATKEEIEGLYDQLHLIEDDIKHVKAEECVLIEEKVKIINRIDELKKQAVNMDIGSFELKAERIKEKLDEECPPT